MKSYSTCQNFREDQELGSNRLIFYLHRLYNYLSCRSTIIIGLTRKGEKKQLLQLYLTKEELREDPPAQSNMGCQHVKNPLFPTAKTSGSEVVSVCQNALQRLLAFMLDEPC